MIRSLCASFFVESAARAGFRKKDADKLFLRISFREKYSLLPRWKEELSSDQFHKSCTGKRGSVQSRRNNKAEQLAAEMHSAASESSIFFQKLRKI